MLTVMWYVNTPAFRGQNADVFNVKTGGTYSDHFYKVFGAGLD